MPTTSSGGTGPRKYDGEYVSEVVSVEDPKKWGRAQVRVSQLFDGVNAADLPWATFKQALGTRPNEGGHVPVQVGDLVWVDFPFGGDTRRPRIVGGVHFCPDSIPNLPHELWAGPDVVQHKRTEPEVMPDAPIYYRDVIFKQHGVLFEIIKATGAARLTQIASGSAVEIDAKGNVTAHSENNLYASAVNDASVKVGKDAVVEVGKTATVTAGTSATLNAPIVNLNANQINLKGNISTSGTSGGIGTEIKNANTEHTGSLSLNGPLNVEGDITASGTIRGATVIGHHVES